MTFTLTRSRKPLSSLPKSHFTARQFLTSSRGPGWKDDNHLQHCRPTPSKIPTSLWKKNPFLLYNFLHLHTFPNSHPTAHLMIFTLMPTGVATTTHQDHFPSETSHHMSRTLLSIFIPRHQTGVEVVSLGTPLVYVVMTTTLETTLILTTNISHPIITSMKI